MLDKDIDALEERLSKLIDYAESLDDEGELHDFLVSLYIADNKLLKLQHKRLSVELKRICEKGLD